MALALALALSLSLTLALTLALTLTLTLTLTPIKAKSIVFAGGPFTDGLRKLEDPECKPAVGAGGGSHIVLPGYYSPQVRV